jgi:hypothetical protein
MAVWVPPIWLGLGRGGLPEVVPLRPTARDYTTGANAGAKKDFRGLAAVATEDVRYRASDQALGDILATTLGGT